MWSRMWCGSLLLGVLLPGAGWAEGGKPLSEIVRSVEQQGYSPTEVELEGNAWEVEATKDGKTYELTIDPKSGETLSVEEEKEETDNDKEDSQAERTAEESTEVPQMALRQLDWLVGDWVDQRADATIKTKCRWTGRGHFLAQTFSVESEGEIVLEGTQVIAWDPIRQQIRSWMFDSEGGIGIGSWIQDGDHWNVKTSQTLATGDRASAINVYTPVDENTIRWKSINREIEGEIQPNIPEVTIVRQGDD